MTNYGYYVFGRDMLNVNPKTLSENGVTDLFLNYYAFTTHGESKVKSWIKNANTYNIHVHIWMQCFYDGIWRNPKTTDLTGKLKEAKKYANTTGVYGLHLDYLRYPGDAYKTGGGADAITAFVKKVRTQNPKVFLSCAVMPETECKKYYGQDIGALGKIVDVVIPMQYKGNYNAGDSWLASTTKLFASKATIWSALQSYKSDNDPTILTSAELEKDIKTCVDNKSEGAILFRYGLAPNIRFKSDNMADYVYTYPTILGKAKSIKKNVEKEYKLGEASSWGYYIAKSILTPNKSVKKIKIKSAKEPSGTYISRQIFKTSYIDLAEKYVKHVEKHGQSPDNLKFTTQSGKSYNIRLRDLIYMFSRILVYYDTNKAYPKYANCTSKSFTKPYETTDEIYAYFVKIFGKITCIDDALEKIAGKGYGYYYDDHKSNKQTIDAIASSNHGDDPNCTDSTQMMKHVADGTEKYKKVDCVHVKCNDGDGHVFLKITQKDGGVFYRDPAAVLKTGIITKVWCSDGTVLGINPSWWVANLNK